MKKLIAFTPLILFGTCLPAQGVFSNNTISCLEKVMRDYPHRFSTIMGELVKKSAREDVFQSKIRLSGSLYCKVTRYENPGRGTSYSWNCAVRETSDHDSALNIFRELFFQMKNSIIRLSGDKPAILNSSCNKPAEDTVVFDLLPGQGEIRKLRVSLSMEKEGAHWLVSIHVYEAENPSEAPVLANH